ncbi:MAG: glycoside hydrolase family 3 protein [Bacteroidota bacterium]
MIRSLTLLSLLFLPFIAGSPVQATDPPTGSPASEAPDNVSILPATFMEILEDPVADHDQPLAQIRTGLDVTRMMAGTTPWIEETLAGMNLQQKVGQMLSPRINSHYMSADAESFREMAQWIDELGLGGITFFSGDVYALSTLIDEFQQMSDVPLLVSADFERGIPMRIRRGTAFPEAMALGAANDPLLAYRMGLVTGLEGRSIGVHQNFAPLADVNNNPDNPVINIRSFGEDPARVGALASAWMRGLHDGGMISTAKHFPGHGDTDLDSHYTLPSIPHDRERLDQMELKPFQELIDNGVLSVMTAHLAIPALTEEEGLPATLSHNILTDLLREDLKFGGLVVTDALDMQGIDHFFDRSEAAIRAVKAGADIILLPPDPVVAHEAIVSAVRLGEISEERINTSVRRILAAKEAVGLTRYQPSDANDIRRTVGIQSHRELALEIARRSITNVRDRQDLMPLSNREIHRPLLITLSDREGQVTAVHRYDSPNTAEPAGSHFETLIGEKMDRFRTGTIDARTNELELEKLIEEARASDLILIHSYIRSHRVDDQEETVFPGEIDRALRELDRLDVPTALVSFGDPYLLRQMPEADLYVNAWSSVEPSVKAAVEALFGEIEPRGRMPVRIPGMVEIGESAAQAAEIK